MLDSMPASVLHRLVLLPGMDGTDVFFRPFIAALPPGVVVQTIDYSSFDASSYDAFAERLVERLPADPFFLLGWSFSGPLALRLAPDLVPRLQGVILVASFASRPLRYLPAWMAFLARPALLALYPTASMMQAIVLGQSTPAFRALQREAFSKVTTAALAKRARMVLGVDVLSYVRTCPVPILYLRASQDRLIHRDHGPLIVREAPRATLVDVPGPHLCLATHPAEAAQAVLEFLRPA